MKSQAETWRLGIIKKKGLLMHYSEKELRSMVRRWLPRDRVPKRIAVKDTADFFRVDYDDVVLLDKIPYLVRNNEREGGQPVCERGRGYPGIRAEIQLWHG